MMPLSMDDYRSLAGYFNRESVTFLGNETDPITGAVFALGSSLILANFSTLAEEISFRGMMLQNTDIHQSSLYFGAASSAEHAYTERFG